VELNYVSEINIEKRSTLKEVMKYLGVGRETVCFTVDCKKKYACL
jgi:hypothetical protein